MVHHDGLIDWKPGQSGNPAGGSKKVRARKLVRDFIGQRVNERVSPEIVEQMAKLGITAEHLTFGDLIAMRIVASAAMGDDKATDQLLSTEPKLLTVESAEPARSPEFVPTSNDEAEFEDAATDKGLVH